MSATAYHETLGEFRGELVTTALDFEHIKDECRKTNPDAYMAALMAAHYGYTLAAILGVADREFGPEIAQRLAAVAAEILTNGDGDDRNADVQPDGQP